MNFRISIVFATVLLVGGSVGCAATQPTDKSHSQISVAERERIASGTPAEDWKLRLYPESIARSTKLHTVGKVVWIGEPVEANGDGLDYVPLRINCMQGEVQGEMTFRFIPSWDSDDAILRIQVGQRVLASFGRISEDQAGKIAIPVENLYLIDDDQTMKLLDKEGTVVGNLNNFRTQFGLD